jgi:ATP-dependent DNA ligase
MERTFDLDISVAEIDPTKLARPEFADYGSKVYEAVKESGHWVAELKHDGWRCMAQCGDFVSMWTRHGRRIEDTPRKIREALTRLPAGTVLDGELIRGAYIDRYIVWDCLSTDGRDLRNCPLSERIMRLGEIITQDLNPHVVIVNRATTPRDKEMMWKCREQRDAEGVVYKRLSDTYPPEGGAVWLKVK